MRSVQKQGTAPIGSLLLQYSLPAVAGFLANALYQFVDRVIVGRGVGTEGMAAVTSAYPLTMLAMGVGLLLGTGTGNMISTHLGKGDVEAAEKTLGQSLRLGVLLGAALSVVLCLFARPILRLCGAEGEVLEMAIPYLRITAVGQIFLIAIISMGNILRTQGRPGLGLAFMVSGNVVNGLLCALGVFGLGLGVSGAAWATFLALAINLAALLTFVQSRHSILRIRRRNLSRDPELAARIVKLGAPVFLMQILGTLTFLAANHGAAFVGGTRGIAMVGVFNTVSILLIYPALGVAQAMQPLVAFNRGAGNVDRVRALLGSSLAITTAIGLAAALAVGALPGPVASLFTRSDTQLVAMVRDGLPLFMVSIALFGVQGTASHYFLAIHQPRKAGLLLLGRQLLAIPLFLFVPRWFGIHGLYLVAALSDAPMAIVSVVLLRSEWKRLSKEANASPTPLATALAGEPA